MNSNIMRVIFKDGTKNAVPLEFDYIARLFIKSKTKEINSLVLMKLDNDFDIKKIKEIDDLFPNKIRAKSGIGKQMQFKVFSQIYPDKKVEMLKSVSKLSEEDFVKLLLTYYKEKAESL